jgi:hypothetical protein
MCYCDGETDRWSGVGMQISSFIGERWSALNQAVSGRSYALGFLALTSGLTVLFVQLPSSPDADGLLAGSPFAPAGPGAGPGH